MSETALPPSFRSLYRLALRSISASVRHQPSATRSLRTIWRPTFEAAASVSHRLQDPDTSLEEHEKLEKWYAAWQSRMDNTLSLLCDSATSKGVAKKAIQNLSFLHRSHRTWVRERYYGQKNIWKPNLKSGEYHPPILPPRDGRSRFYQNLEQKQNARVYDEDAWNPLSELVQMAEGRDGVSLGRVRLKRWNRS